MTEYDLIVIGSGPGGYATAAEAARMGRRTMIVERDELGGTCLNRGCIPTKALCRSAEVAMTVASAAGYGVHVSGVTLDYTRAVARKDEVVAALREGVALKLKDVDVVRGDARFVAPRVVEINGEEYGATQIIVATGSRAAVLDIPGASYAVDSDFMLQCSELPQSLVIVGGGVIGMEFASVLCAFGVEVTVLEYCPEILPGFDRDVAKRLRMAMKRRGVTVVTGAQVTSISEDLTVTYLVKGKEKSVSGSMVLMAVGRRAAIPEGLEEQGVRIERGFIATDSNMATDIPGVYAVGDVNGRCMLAHAATAQGRVALGLDQPLDPVPAAVFTTPECAMTGLTEEACEASGIDYATGSAIYRANGKALASGEADGLVKVIVTPDGSRILGCHICGAHAADLIQEVAVAQCAGLSAAEVARCIHGHPTLSELVQAALNDVKYRQVDNI